MILSNRINFRNINYSESDFANFGVPMKARDFSSNVSRFGFNGMEKDEETETMDFGARLLDGDLGVWLALDPLAAKYPAVSPYAYALNSPLLFNDPDGKDAVVTVQKDPNGGGKITIASTIYITGKAANEFNANKYTQKAAQLYKPGQYTNEKGEKFEIVFDVKFEYAPDKSKIQKQDGDNILEYNENNIRSHIKGSYQVDVDVDGNISNVKRFTGNVGEIGKQDAIGSSYTTTIHETLHFLGLSDRYEEDTSGETQPDKGFEKDIMGIEFEIQMNQIHYDNFGKAFSGKETGVYILKERVDTKSSDGSLIGGSSDGQRPIPKQKKE